MYGPSFEACGGGQVGVAGGDIEVTSVYFCILLLQAGCYFLSGVKCLGGRAENHYHHRHHGDSGIHDNSGIGITAKSG